MNRTAFEFQQLFPTIGTKAQINNLNFNNMETTFRQKYNQLEQELYYEFSYLLATAKQEIKFFEGDEFTDEDQEEWGNNIYETRNNITGGCYDVFILSAGEDGLYVSEVNNTERQYFIKFSDLASILDRINLIEEIQEFCQKQIKQ